MALIVLPIIFSIVLMIFLPCVVYFAFAKIFKITFLFSFSISYLFIMLMLFIFQDKQPLSEFYDRLFVMGPVIFSFPAGIIPIFFKGNFFINYYKTPFILIFGTFQWLFMSFLERKMGRNNKTFRTILYILLIIVILFALLFLVFALLFGNDLE